MDYTQKSITGFTINNKKNISETFFEDGLILLVTEIGECFYLNSTACFLWRILKNTSTCSLLLNELDRYYPSQLNSIETDIETWLENLYGYGLLMHSTLVNKKNTKNNEILMPRFYTSPTIHVLDLLKSVAGGKTDISESGDGMIMQS